MRVSDAERSAMADVLSRHYGDGRLDEAEFNERLGRAMAAKTRGDLRGLLDDLPMIAADGSVPATTAAPVVSRHRHRPLLLLVVGVLVLSSLSSWVFFPHVPWLLVFFVALFFWRRSHWGWHGGFGWRARHHHHHFDEPMSQPVSGYPRGGGRTWL
ncbi:MAG: DUF1707 SHOCT-like domain-containing protein [Terriglobales bacterium]